jgi:hypothetical protein
MRIAPVVSSTPSPIVARPHAGPAAPAGAATMTGPDGLPATDVARRVGRDLLQVPGASGLTWGSAAPSTLYIDFSDEATARVAAGLFEPTIDGVNIVARVGDTVVTAPDHESPASAADRVRAIAAMRGIWDTRYAETSQYQHGRVVFSAVDQETVDRLDAILRDRLTFGWMPETFAKRFLSIQFAVTLPGGSSSSPS